MFFKHECYVNRSLGIKEIWFKNIWDQKHFGSKSILIQTYFPNFFESVLNLSGMCFEHECLKYFDSNKFSKKIEAVLNLSGMCFEHECLFLIIA